jgi:hypothetical protein
VVGLLASGHAALRVTKACSSSASLQTYPTSHRSRSGVTFTTHECEGAQKKSSSSGGAVHPCATHWFTPAPNAGSGHRGRLQSGSWRWLAMTTVNYGRNPLQVNLYKVGNLDRVRHLGKMREAGRGSTRFRRVRSTPRMDPWWAGAGGCGASDGGSGARRRRRGGRADTAQGGPISPGDVHVPRARLGPEGCDSVAPLSIPRQAPGSASAPALRSIPGMVRGGS